MVENKALIKFKEAINYSIFALTFSSLLSFIVVVFTQVVLIRTFNFRPDIPIKISHFLGSVFHLTSVLYIISFYYLISIKSLKPLISKITVVIEILVILCLFSDFIIFSAKFISFNISPNFSVINSILWNIFYLLGLMLLVLFFKYSNYRIYRNISVILILLYSVAILFLRLPVLFSNRIDISNIIPLLNLMES